MAGKKGRSGPPGNTHNLQNVGRLYWEKGILRSKDRGIRKLVRQQKAELVAQFPNATAVEKRFIELALVARTCTVLILKESEAQGFLKVVDGEPHLSAAAMELPRFMNCERRCLALLSGERLREPKADLARDLQRLSRTHTLTGEPDD